MEIILDYPDGPSIILRVLKSRRKRESQGLEGNVTMEGGCNRCIVAGFEGVGRGHQPKNVGVL